LRQELRESQYAFPGAVTQSRPLSDPQNQTRASQLSFHQTARLVIGCIAGATAVANVYKVFFEKAKTPGIAYFAPRTTCGVSGPRELTTLQPGSLVLCACHPQLIHSVILCVLPSPNTDPYSSIAQVLFGASRARVDEIHKAPLRTPFNGMIADMLAGRPFDATMAGEAGWISATGMRIFIDDWIATLGADENCAVTAHFHDQLLRVAGYNYQHWTAAREHESMNDQNEVLDWLGVATYIHEQLGQFSAGGNPFKQKTGAEWQTAEPWYSNIEPADDWQMPFHRLRQFLGYLGQGGKYLLQAPPATAPNNHASYQGGSGLSGVSYPGLLDISATLDGRLLVGSAKGISIAKRAVLISPSRLRRPEQPSTGDSPSSYRFAGLSGSGPEHVITGDVAIPAEDKTLSRPAGIIDLHAYFFNYASLHPFHYHAKDYHVPEESATTHTGGKTMETPPFSTLGSTMYLDTEAFKHSVPIDHRYGSSDFYTLGSGFDLLDDGAVVLYGGCGEEIRLVGGSIVLACPGDIWLKAGRNVIQWAGSDAITRAKNSVDISATDHDVRIKAEQNMQMVSGNSGSGSTVIENRGSGSTYDFSQLGEQAGGYGIIFKSAGAQIATLSAGLYLRTGGGDVGTGPIILDANNGQASLIKYAADEVSYLANGASQFFGSAEAIIAANNFSATANSFGAAVRIDGGIIASADVVIRGNFIAAGGHIITEEAAVEPTVRPLIDQPLSDVYQAVGEMEESIATQLTQQGGTVLEALRETFYSDQQIGNDDTIRRIQFSFRQLADYRTQDFRIFEDRWQQMGRLAGTATSVWEEKAVVCGGIETYPYPGREGYQGYSLLTQDLTLFSVPEGHAIDRGIAPNLADAYKSPTLATPQRRGLSQYIVTR
jgi:hypothetical protein